MVKNALPLAAVVPVNTEDVVSWRSSIGSPLVGLKQEFEALTQTPSGVLSAVMEFSKSTTKHSSRLPGLLYSSTPLAPTGMYRLSLKSIVKPISSEV